MMNEWSLVSKAHYVLQMGLCCCCLDDSPLYVNQHKRIVRKRVQELGKHPSFLFIEAASDFFPLVATTS